MAINPLGGVGPSSISGAGIPSKVGQGAEGFGKVLKGQSAPSKPVENAAIPVQQPTTEAKGATKAVGGKCRADAAQASSKVEGSTGATATKVLDHVTAAQKKMDQILKAAESGRSFSPAELLSLQAHVYRASQELDLAGKVVEKATNGVKQVLQTQV